MENQNKRFAMILVVVVIIVLLVVAGPAIMNAIIAAHTVR